MKASIISFMFVLFLMFSCKKEDAAFNGEVLTSGVWKANLSQKIEPYGWLYTSNENSTTYQFLTNGSLKIHVKSGPVSPYQIDSTSNSNLNRWRYPGTQGPEILDTIFTAEWKYDDFKKTVRIIHKLGLGEFLFIASPKPHLYHDILNEKNYTLYYKLKEYSGDKIEFSCVLSDNSIAQNYEFTLQR